MARPLLDGPFSYARMECRRGSQHFSAGLTRRNLYELGPGKSGYTGHFCERVKTSSPHFTAGLNNARSCYDYDVAPRCREHCPPWLVLKALRRDTAALADRETRYDELRFISPVRRLIREDQAGGTMTLSARGWIRNVAGVRVTTSPSISIGIVGSESSTRVRH